MPPSRVPDGPGLMLRVRVWRKKLDLDAALAGGADPVKSEELELRAKQLVDRKTRERMATAITRLIGVADGRRAAMVTPQSPFTPSQVRANRALLLQLAERLRDTGSVALRGMALTSLLLGDARGPLSTGSDPLTLERGIRAALSALNADPHPRQPAQRPVGRNS
jgi:hypothetical protein